MKFTKAYLQEIFHELQELYKNCSPKKIKVLGWYYYSISAQISLCESAQFYII